ncbi:MAG: carbohydrate binding family 9 domain-containing protein, partial [Acidobacteriota bacterium]
MRVVILLVLLSSICYSQSLTVYNLADNENIKLDGILNEAFWPKADSISSLTMIDPVEGKHSAFNTVVKIAADNKNIYLGITCYDPEPDKIISISKTRDAYLSDEDRVIFVFDTHLDKRTGYIFAVNPYGTRYDALVFNSGEAENSSWDGMWDAATKRTPIGWTAEIVIPV